MKHACRAECDFTMKQLKIFVLLFVILIPGLLQTRAQQANAILDTNAMLVGDQVDFRLNFKLPEDYRFEWPQFGDTLTGGLEIVKKSNIDTTRNNGQIDISQVLTLTAFDSGYYVLPPVTFRYGQTATNISNQIETEPYLLNVFTVQVDTTQAIRPIKGPISVGYTFAEILPWLLLALLVIGVVALAIYFNKQRKQKKPFVFIKPKPKIPPHKAAMQELEKLKKEKLWQQGKIKEYHTRLTEIVREYIEERFRVSAVEMTTWEIMQSVQKLNLSEHDKNALRYLLETADLVKFAKARPLPDEHEKCMENAQDFVVHTQPVSDDKTGQTEESKKETVEQVG